MKNKKKIAIIGHGFVGKATDWGFDINVEKLVIDPRYKNETKDLLDFKPDFIFVCVPTPMGNDGNQNSEIITKVLSDISSFGGNAITIIKSTVLPDILIRLKEINERIIYNPEFLREKHASEDFINSELIILGGERNIASKVSELYITHSRCECRDHIFVDLLTASLIKYTINTFLATKVVFFNEIFSLFKNLKQEDTWEKFISTVSLDSRIGKSHMMVPGHDGRFGFGGACFPKDSSALLKYTKKNSKKLSVLTAAIETNNTIRSTIPRFG